MFSSGDVNDLRCKVCGAGIGLTQHKRHGKCELCNDMGLTLQQRHSRILYCESMYVQPAYKGPRNYYA